MTQPIVELCDVSLSYRLSRSKAGSIKEVAIQMVKGQVKHEQLTALSGVSFSVRPGEVLAVIGSNGAGKSTLMKIIARVLSPTTGRVVVRGRTAPMIELGAGFNMELTGFENTLLYGTLLGNSPSVMRGRASAIADWADLSDYMDVPLRSYSSGMITRLAFSVAVDVRPDVLVVDEVLSVGDEAFRRKSSARMAELIASGTAVVLVSHDMSQVLENAHRVLWLERGHVRQEGSPEEVVTEYRASV